MAEDEYTLQELSDLSGVEPRTIRSYIERDLLPGPRSLGRNASYGQEHVDRLEVIRLLRNARHGITLDQIRGLLVQLSPSVIGAIASGETPVGELVDRELPPQSSALGYLKGLRGLKGLKGHQRRQRLESVEYGDPEPQSMAIHHSYSPSPAQSPGSHQTPLEELLDLLRGVLKTEHVARSVRDATWHRISITPDIELSIRGELDTDQLAALRRVGDHLRHLLTKGAPR